MATLNPAFTHNLWGRAEEIVECGRASKQEYPFACHLKSALQPKKMMHAQYRASHSYLPNPMDRFLSFRIINMLDKYLIELVRRGYTQMWIGGGATVAFDTIKICEAMP